MYILTELHPVGAMATLDNAKGANGQIARDSTNGDLHVKRTAGWQKIIAGGTTPSEVGLSIQVKNSANTVTRTLTESGGVVNLAATDAIVANNDSLVLKKSDGTTTSAGNATLNSPATAVVSAGVVSNVKASA
jgi:hypothetical protein